MCNKMNIGSIVLMLFAASLMLAGCITLSSIDNCMQYVLPAHTSSKLESIYFDANRILGQMSDTITVSSVSARAQNKELLSAQKGNNASDFTTVYAVGAGYFDLNHERLIEGRLISESDIGSTRKVIVIDDSTALTLYRGESALEKPIIIDNVIFRVIGVIDNVRRIGEVDHSVAYIPITTASQEMLEMETIEITAKGVDTISSAAILENTLRTWNSTGCFYNFSKMKLGAALPLRWAFVAFGIEVVFILWSVLRQNLYMNIRKYQDELRYHYIRELIPGFFGKISISITGVLALIALTYGIALICTKPLYIFGEWIPEVFVDLSSITNTFWNLNNINSRSIRYLSRSTCCIELAQGYLSWGIGAFLLSIACQYIESLFIQSKHA